MKKIMLSLSVAAALLTLSSCGGDSLKADIQKRAKMECQQDKLREKMDKGDTTVNAEYEKLKKEADEFDKKMEAKYKDKEKDTAFAAKAMKYMLEAQADCK